MQGADDCNTSLILRNELDMRLYGVKLNDRLTGIVFHEPSFFVVAKMDPSLNINVSYGGGTRDPHRTVLEDRW